MERSRFKPVNRLSKYLQIPQFYKPSLELLGSGRIHPDDTVKLTYSRLIKPKD